MSLVFGGKLLAPKESNGQTSDVHKATLNALTKQEKLLLTELEKTRSNIAKQVSPYAVLSDTSNLGTQKLTVTRKKRLAATAKAKTSIDMLPMFSMSATVIPSNPFVPAPIRKQAPIKIPVFSLPTIKAKPNASMIRTRSRAGLRSRGSERDLNVDNVRKYRSILSLLNSMIDEALIGKELSFAMSYLKLTSKDVDDIHTDIIKLTRSLNEHSPCSEVNELLDTNSMGIKRQLTSGAVQHLGDQYLAMSHPADDASSMCSSSIATKEDVSNYVSVFMKVKSGFVPPAVSKQQQSFNSAAGSQGDLNWDDILGSSASAELANVPHGQTAHFEHLGLGYGDTPIKDTGGDTAFLANSFSSTVAPMAGFTLSAAAKANRLKRASSLQNVTTSTSMDATRGNNQQSHNQTLIMMSKTSTARRKQSASNCLNSSKSAVSFPPIGAASNMRSRTASGSQVLGGSTALKIDLLGSLQKMQGHTTMVKEGILGMQDLINSGNSKIRDFVLTISAEKMRACIEKLIVKEQKRGFSAWCLMIQRAKKADFVKRYINFCGLRYLAQILASICMKIMKKTFQNWVRYSYLEGNRIQAEKEAAAALVMQRYIRGTLGRMRVNKMREVKQLQTLYTSTILLQKLFRGKIHRWRYLKYLRKKLEDKSRALLQRVIRGHFGRCRASAARKQRRQIEAAILIQARVRGILVRVRIQEMHLLQIKNFAAVKIQSVIRGFLGRRHLQAKAHLGHQHRAAIKIQSVIRGCLVRFNIDRKRAQIMAERSMVSASASKIQAAYRGYRGRLIYRMFLINENRRLKVHGAAVTKITTMVRGFLARVNFQIMKKEQYDNWIVTAKMWDEKWSEDSQCWFYVNEETGESLWEPSQDGYTKSDGRLVLPNGAIIDDPTLDAADDEEEETNDRYCVECNDRVAIRACNDCFDRFCTKCYKETHAIGSRKAHTWEAIGPIDCTECEQQLAERWCVSCDEAFCDMCWRKVHAKGNRRFHPFSDINGDGRVDSKIMTMDGSEVNDYEATYALHQGQMAEEEVEGEGYEGEYGEDYDGGEYPQAAEADENSEWQQAYDDGGNVYWYNQYTGVSQYEDPFEGAY